MPFGNEKRKKKTLFCALMIYFFLITMYCGIIMFLFIFPYKKRKLYILNTVAVKAY